MRRLMHVLHRRGAANDRGVVGVLVGVLISAGVLFGFAALVIDVGQIYGERAYLQNGADAGALAVARACASQQLDCSTLLGAENTAKRYADENATNDDVSALDGDVTFPVCGNDDLGLLPPCPESTGAITDCPPTPPSGTEYVDVHTATLTGAGASLLPPVFARTLLGNEDYDGKKVRACARAEWGTPSAANGLALTISWCEWNEATGGSDETRIYAPPPPLLATSVHERVLVLHSPGNGAQQDAMPTCEAGPSGSDIPGGFGWTDPTDEGTCETFFESDGTYSADPGNNVSQECQQALIDAYNNYPTVLTIPIYTGHAEEQGTNGTYTLWEPAAFVLTGYKLPNGLNAPSKLTGRTNCKTDYVDVPGAKCIFGYFTTGTTSGNLGEGSDAGVSVVQLTG